MELSDPVAAAALFREEALALGFQRVGFAPVSEVARHSVYEAWLQRGFGADMSYLKEGAAARRDPRSVLASARTIITVALSYKHDPVPAERLTRGPTGVVARYARGDDYHFVLKRKLFALADAVREKTGDAFASVPCVDTAPLLERELAARGGIGFQAKNTMLIAPGAGSFVVLGELLTDVDCAPSPLGDAEPRCGACRRCLDACPTGAFTDAYTLDARRCIAYLTIENTGPIPRELRRLVGDRIFGCDVCQDVCPFNHGAAPPGAPELLPRPGYHRQPLTALLGLGAAQFRKWQQGSALRRVHRAQLQRNVAVALGNVGGVDELPALMQALGEPSPLVRAHVAWAIGEITSRHALPEAGERALDALVDAAYAREADAETKETLGAIRGRSRRARS